MPPDRKRLPAGTKRRHRSVVTVPKGTLVVAVLDRETNRGIESATVRVTGAGSTSTNASGVARISLPPGDRTIDVSHPDFRPAAASAPETNVAAGNTVKLTVQMAPDGAIEGSVSEPASPFRAIAGAKVTLKERPKPEVVTDASGHFKLVDLRVASTYEVRSANGSAFVDAGDGHKSVKAVPQAQASKQSVSLRLQPLSLAIEAVAAPVVPEDIFVNRSPVQLRANAAPAGGTFAWVVKGPPGVVRIDGASGNKEVALRSDDISKALSDVEVVARYTWKTGQVLRGIKLTALRVHLDVDANRDGVIDKDNPKKFPWKFGKAGGGAVVLCNCDDDDGKGSADNADEIVNGSKDVADLAPLVVRALGPLKPGRELVLACASDRALWRIFDKRAVGAAVAIGPVSASSEFKIPNPGVESTLGVEATDFPDDGKSPLLDLELVLREGGKKLAGDKVQMRVAPWMIPSHSEHSDKVFVVNTGETAANHGGWDQTGFLGAIASFAGKAGAAVFKQPQLFDPAAVGSLKFKDDDRWMQDCMEIGFTSMAGQGMHVVFHNARGRPLGTFPPTLRKADFGVFQKGVSDASFNYGGNLEVSPPVKVGGKNFPLGRMIYGATGRPGEDMDIDKFLTAQVVQDPVRLDTSWLTVGHVDEILTFLPVGKGGFRLAMASAQRALDILDQLKAAGHGSAPVMKGRQTLHWLTGAPTGSEESTVAAILADPSAMSFNTTVAATLKAERAKLVAGLGLKDADVIELPVLYKENPSAPGLADAMTAGMVNMLVTNGHCAVPKPFGPVVGGMDKFQEEAKAKLSALGLAVEFVDDWFTYHVQLGEVHCGTNTLRREKQFAWWEFEP